LIDLNEELGGTQLWEGTHRLGLEEETQGQPTVVYTKAGSALLFDYRVYHGGMGSTADIVRPTLYISYSQPWFRDTLAYDSHFALGMTKEELDGMDEAHRDMFRFATVLPS
jgi:ectoine hydroxylase-related dioxygenase (phytanoyl-CoA dioxygenase family)